MTPRRRIWLYVPEEDVLEVAIFGSELEIAAVLPRFRNTLEQWAAFRQVELIGSCPNVIVFRAIMTKHARVAEPIGEFLQSWLESGHARALAVIWTSGGSSWGGTVGTW